ATVLALMISETKVYVVRCSASPEGYTVAVSFEAPVADESSIARISGEQKSEPGSDKPRPSN
ncbi:MAG TPA: hypothetical protein VGB96_04245, partial [Archangium sp.]